MPVPLPYFHALNMLQNVNYALYTYALCSFNSYLTPIVLFVVILITVGMREVAAALSNPFGDDDVDFPVNKCRPCGHRPHCVPLRHSMFAPR